MQKFGFLSKFIKWCHNCLTNHSQFVQIDIKKSRIGCTQFGVPQGSVLGLLYFNIYVNDLADSLPSNLNSMQYTDDTSLYLHSKPDNLVSGFETFSNTSSDLHVRSARSHLVANREKTKSMIISTPQIAHRHNLQDLNMEIYFDGTQVEQVPMAKILGMYLDSLKAILSGETMLH